jgi:hypothetical protein
MQSLMVLLVLVAIIAIFATTPAGKRLSVRLGLNLSCKGRAPQEDHDYLLRVCNGDFTELGERLTAARRNNPEMTEAEVYRRAIRVYLQSKS